MRIIKKLIKKFIKNLGYDIIKLNPYFTFYPKENTDNGILQKVLKELNIELLFDIGANNGDWAMDIKKNGYSGQIFSFEPQTESFKILEDLSSNDSRWESFNYGLGDSDSEEFINISKNLVSSSCLPILDKHTEAETDSRYHKKELIKIKKIDSLFHNLVTSEKKVFMKIDTQGYEFKVLEGAKRIINRVSGLIIEMSFTELYKGEVKFSKMKKYLEGLGFLLVHIQDGFKDSNTGELLQVDAIFKRN